MRPMMSGVGGVPVTAANASDVLGNADEGATVTYNAETKTLTLNGAAITVASAVPDDISSAAIVSYDDLNIVLAEGSENSITLDDSGSIMGVVAMSEGGTNNDVKDINVSGNGSLNIDITTSKAAAFGIMGSAVTIDGGAEVGVTVNGTSTEPMVAYIGVMGYSSVALKGNSTVTATVSDKEGTNVAIMSTGAVTIDNADVTAGGYTGIMSSAGDISITGESTVKATGTGYAIATVQNNNITWDDDLAAEGRGNAAEGDLSAVETGNSMYNTFVLSSDSSTVAQYVEIKLAHSHNVCGETECGHEGHTDVSYTALDNGEGGLAGGCDRHQ